MTEKIRDSVFKIEATGPVKKPITTILPTPIMNVLSVALLAYVLMDNKLQLRLLQLAPVITLPAG
jgi:hypothetical protein